jgi:hypothetical protein
MGSSPLTSHQPNIRNIICGYIHNLVAGLTS